MPRDLFRLIWRHLLRHPFRSILTALGIAVALFSFSFIQIMLHAWHSDVEQSTKNRLVVRNSVSLVFYLPRSYAETIARVPGVTRLGFANWFGGIFREKRYRFAQFAIDDNYLDLYPDFVMSAAERTAFNQERSAAILGRAIADEYNLHIGDTVQIQGTIFPGLWQFTIQGIFDGENENVDTRLMFFHWDYLNERNRREIGRQPDYVGFYVVEVKPGVDPAPLSAEIDRVFANSFAETLTETETAFQQSFVAMSSELISCLHIVSIVVIIIMLLVLTNTMLMSYRERYQEYSILKTLGFKKTQLTLLIFGESALLTIVGCGIVAVFLGIFLSIPPRLIFGEVAAMFSGLRLTASTISLILLISLLVATLSALVPIRALMQLNVTQGLRRLH